MPNFDVHGNKCDRQLRLHIRRIHHLAFDPYETIRSTQLVFGPVGVQVELCSLQSMNTPLKDLSRFARIQGPYDFNTTDADRFEMYSRYGVQDLASVTVFLISALAPILNRNGTTTRVAATAASTVQRPAVFLGAFASPWDLAHELGHLLLLPKHREVHSRDPNNFMFSYSRWAPSTPTVSPEQAAVLRASPLLVAC